jgi:hypothetical protein
MNWDANLDGLQEMIEFFGCGLNHVNPIIMRIGLTYRPDWLQGRHKLNLLPRWKEDCEHCVGMRQRWSPSEVGARLVWVVEELHGGWKLSSPEGFHFETDSDAVYFKMRWS